MGNAAVFSAGRPLFACSGASRGRSGSSRPRPLYAGVEQRPSSGRTPCCTSILLGATCVAQLRSLPGGCRAHLMALQTTIRVMMARFLGRQCASSLLYVRPAVVVRLSRVVTCCCACRVVLFLQPVFLWLLLLLPSSTTNWPVCVRWSPVSCRNACLSAVSSWLHCWRCDSAFPAKPAASPCLLA